MAAKTKKTAAKKPGVTTASKKPTEKKENKRTMASVAYAMIQAGKTNAEVRTALEKEFGLPEKHAYYPAWYRSKLVQDGTISKDFAGSHSGEPAKKEKAPKKSAVKKETAARPSKPASQAGLGTATHG